jgi:hypothetical protein
MSEPSGMRLYASLLVLWVGLLGALSPAFACVDARSDGSCCPPDAPADCRVAWTLERSEFKGSISCIATPAASRLAFVDADRKRDAAASDGGLTTWSGVLAAAPSEPRGDFSVALLLVANDASSSADASLTYLRTGRLRL